MSNRYHDFSIEIDCPPGLPRPGELFPGVLKGTGLKEADFTNTSRFMGAWVWVLNEGSPDRDTKFTASKSIFKERLEELYHQGVVRYATW